MIRKYAEIFCWKNVSSFCSAKATHIFSAKNIRILCIESAKTVNKMTLNELVKLTTLWTIRPSTLWLIGVLYLEPCQDQHKYQRSLISLSWHCLSVTQLPGSIKNLGPVVQSVVSLTSSLRVISSTVLADSIFNILKFFAEKMWVAFALQKLLTFFQQNISAYLRITWFKF